MKTKRTSSTTVAISLDLMQTNTLLILVNQELLRIYKLTPQQKAQLASEQINLETIRGKLQAKQKQLRRIYAF